LDGYCGGFVTKVPFSIIKLVPSVAENVLSVKELTFSVTELVPSVTEVPFSVTEIVLLVMEIVWLVRKLTFSITKNVWSVADVLRFAFVLIAPRIAAFRFGVACERKRFNNTFPKTVLVPNISTTGSESG
jgi:hypothetical protein